VEKKMTSSEKSVVITGASTGIGWATAIHLDALGFRVFAGIRTEAHAQALAREASDHLTPLFLDVTDEAQVAAAVDQVAESTSGKLFALVNNAGVSLNGPLELLSNRDMKALFDVNVLGLLAVTKAFLPLLRKGGGRLVNISSGHGLLAIPDKSAYAASKFAVQAIGESLRVELRPFGISVSNVVVGKVDTEILGKIVADRQRMIREADPEIVELYSSLIRFFDTEVRDLPGIGPERVAKVIEKALAKKKPKAQYLIGPGARKMKNLARLPVGMRDSMMFRAIYHKHQ